MTNLIKNILTIEIPEAEITTNSKELNGLRHKLIEPRELEDNKETHGETIQVNCEYNNSGNSALATDHDFIYKFNKASYKESNKYFSKVYRQWLEADTETELDNATNGFYGVLFEKYFLVLKR